MHIALNFTVLDLVSIVLVHEKIFIPYSSLSDFTNAILLFFSSHFKMKGAKRIEIQGRPQATHVSGCV